MRQTNLAAALIFSAFAAASAFAQDRASIGGNPHSANASNIEAQNARSEVAPQLPDPATGPEGSPQDFLLAAKSALKSHHTGMAQQALEMAETRALDRSTLVDQAGTPDSSPMIASIHTALADLGTKDLAGAGAAIDEALAGASAGMPMKAPMALPPGAMQSAPMPPSR